MERKLEAVEDRLRLATEVLTVLNQSGGKVSAIREILLRIKASGGFEAVAIRLREGDDFPYYESNGLGAEFVERERSLCARTADGEVIRDAEGAACLECMCGRVIAGKIDPALPLFTKRGSFWTNSTSDLLPDLTGQQWPMRTRVTCNAAGYESVALLPLRSGDTVIGLLQINDRRRGCFTLELIEFLEEMAASIGIALARKQAEEAIRLSEDHFRRTFDQSPIGAAIVTLDYRFQRVNDALCRLTRYTRDELLARGFPDITHADDLAADVGLAKRLFAGEIDQYQMDKRYIRKDGVAVWICLSVRMMRDAEGRPLYYLPMMEDIDQRKRAEEALQVERAFIRQVIDTDPNLVFVKDRLGKFVLVNRAMAALYNTVPEELVGERNAEILANQQEAEHYDWIDKEVLRTNCPKTVEETHTCPDGRALWFLTTKSPIRLPDGTTGIMGVSLNISARKQAEEALRASESHFQTLFVEAPLAYQSLDAEGRIVAVNEAWRRALGYSQDEVIGRSFGDFLAPYYRELFPARFTCFKDTGAIKDVEFTMLRKDGSPIMVSFDGRIAYDEGGHFRQTHCIFQDITERKRAEEALRESEAFANKVLTSSLNGLYIYDVELKILTFINPQYTKLTGYTLADLRLMNGETFFAHFHADDHERIAAHIEAMMQACDDAVREVEYRFRRADGQWIWCLSRETVFARNADGSVREYIGTFLDITDRKQADEMLKRYQLLAENSRDIILFVRHRDGRIVEANAAAIATYGYTRDELLSMHVTELQDAHAHPSAAAEMAGASAPGTVFETIHRCKNGRRLPVEVSSRGVQIGNEQILLRIIRDISERRQAAEVARRQQAELAHLARVTAVGEMASQLAHELSQPLGAMLNYSGVCLDVIRSSSARPELVVGALEEMRKEAIRAGEIIRRVRAFIRKQDAQRQVADIAAVVREATELMAFELRQAGISVAMELADVLPLVVIDRVQIQQVLVNLLQNAIDAEADCRPDERRLTIKAASVDCSAVRVSIMDTGCGIAPESQARVFESFFTTKANGLGMGLAISRSIIESHGGQLAASANADHGMTFEFTLPVG